MTRGHVHSALRGAGPEIARRLWCCELWCCESMGTASAIVGGGTCRTSSRSLAAVPASRRSHGPTRRHGRTVRWSRRCGAWPAEVVYCFGADDHLFCALSFPMVERKARTRRGPSLDQRSAVHRVQCCVWLYTAHLCCGAEGDGGLVRVACWRARMKSPRLEPTTWAYRARPSRTGFGSRQR